MLIVFGGLPGTGKSTIARDLCRKIGACLVRVEEIEQSIVRSGLASHPVGEVGYLVAYAIAEGNLSLGRTVVADSVNPQPVTRLAWKEVGRRAGVDVREIELICSNSEEHRTRVELRTTDIEGLPLLSWRDVIDRDYEIWDQPHVLVDTANRSVTNCVGEIRCLLGL